jgi:hypothetical protein
MNSKRRIGVQVLLLAASVCCVGISSATASKNTEKAAGVEPTAIIQPVGEKQQALAASVRFDEKLATFSASVDSRLTAIDSSIARAGERAAEDRSLARLYALATVVISALFALAAQWLLMRHQRHLERENARAEVANSYVEWQLKQLCELYGPLRALLGQSNAMYRQMNRVLAAARTELFRLRREQGGDFDDEVFEIFIDGQWGRFRTVKHIGEVYNKGYGVEPYFDDVVNVGARMAELIRDKAGYAQPSDQKLIDIMGSYLAHYAVLCRLHQQAKAGQSIQCNQADEQATFPVVIQQLVNDGFATINREIMDWKNDGRSPAKA